MIEEDNYEFALIGLLMKKPELLDHCQLIANFENPFQNYRLNVIFKNIQKLYADTGSCDRRTLIKKGLENGIEIEFYSTIIKQTGFDVSINEYLGKIYNSVVKTQLSTLGHKIVNCINDPLNDAFEYLKQTREVVDSIDKNSAVTTGITMPEAIQEVFDKTERLQQEDQTYYIKTGIFAIDRVIMGFTTKTMSVFAARPSIGKTAGAITMMSNMTAANIACGFISVEMSEAEIIERIAQVRSNVSIYDFNRNDMSDHDKEKFYNQLNHLGSCPHTQIKRTTNRKIGNIRSIARKMKNDNPNLKVVFIDYLQKITGDDKSEDMRMQVSNTSAILTDMATDLDVHICALAQLNRAGDETPKVIHLKESGAIEQDAHYIMLLHRELSDQHQGNYNVDATIAIAKNRGGRTGMAQLKYNCKTTRFYDEVTEEVF